VVLARVLKGHGSFGFNDGKLNQAKGKIKEIAENIEGVSSVKNNLNVKK